MYAGKALVHMNDLTGGYKQFNLENDFCEKLTEFDNNRYFEISSADNAIQALKYNSLIVEVLQSKPEASSKIIELRSHPFISSRIK